jgi:hypothetical protein
MEMATTGDDARTAAMKAVSDLAQNAVSALDGDFE